MKGDKQGKLNIRREHGNSSFKQPFFDFYDTLNNNLEVPELFKKVEASGDHRSLTLITALIIEHNLDRLLNGLFPSYKILTDRQDMTFSLKTDILKALKLIPSHILSCADILRGIRNEFAHNLEIDHIEKISSGKKSTLEQLYKSLYGKEEKDLTLEKMFNGISFLAITGIRNFEQNVKLLREKIDDPNFIEELSKVSLERFNKVVEEISKEEPIEIKQENGLTIKRFKDGYTEIG